MMELGNKVFDIKTNEIIIRVGDGENREKQKCRHEREGGSYGRERGEGVDWRGGSNPSVLPGSVPEISPWGEVGFYYQLLDWISGSAAVSCPTGASSQSAPRAGE